MWDTLYTLYYRRSRTHVRFVAISWEKKNNNNAMELMKDLLQ